MDSKKNQGHWSSSFVLCTPDYQTSSIESALPYISRIASHHPLLPSPHQGRSNALATLTSLSVCSATIALSCSCGHTPLAGTHIECENRASRTRSENE